MSMTHDGIRYYDAETVCRRLRISRATLRKLVVQQYVSPPTRIGRKHYWRVDYIDPMRYGSDF